MRPPGTTATLTVSVGGNGAGQVTSTPTGISCPGTCSASFPVGAQVALNASHPRRRRISLGWSNACTGAAGCQVKLNADAQVGALFGIPGSNVWLRQTGADQAATVLGARFFSNGDLALVGNFAATLKLSTPTITTATQAAGFVARLKASDGSAVWVKTIEATTNAYVTGVAVDTNDDVVITGTYAGTVTLNGAPHTSQASGQDAFVAKLNGTTNAYQWANVSAGRTTTPPTASPWTRAATRSCMAPMRAA